MRASIQITSHAPPSWIKLRLSPTTAQGAQNHCTAYWIIPLAYIDHSGVMKSCGTGQHRAEVPRGEKKGSSLLNTSYFPNISFWHDYCSATEMLPVMLTVRPWLPVMLVLLQEVHKVHF